MNDGKPRARCQATAKSGKPCAAAPMGGGLCFFHANPNKAAELGRIGGRSKRTQEVHPDELPPLRTAEAVLLANSDVFYQLYFGQIPPKLALAMAALLQSQLRAIEAAFVESERNRRLSYRLHALENLESYIDDTPPEGEDSGQEPAA
jgi:hypothetical protein